MKFNISVEIAYAWVLKKGRHLQIQMNKMLQKEIIIVYTEQGLEKENALIQQNPQGKGEANMAFNYLGMELK